MPTVLDAEKRQCMGCPSQCLSMTTQAIYYILLLRPSPFLGVLDFYVLVPFSKLIQRRYQVADLTLRDRLGSGNFGQVAISIPPVQALSAFAFCCYR